ncbi:hypothetical protein [Reichenbachiella ulvae]|uniref:Uncharacterized protein n=1 Tax=Reichenbachiella ulvae TaxID=2980104 RepID=A0ABT3CWJ9_9BACT|nr:hypothetical protein [Reichenbachiella ulvae]MCV9388007.1 hypothetical protein [Reichenbachiella ulvae]
MENEMSFEEYLISKKIDSSKFKLGDAQQYSELKAEFEQMNPNSFTQQKLFIINPLRRKYQLTESDQAVKAKPKKMFKPKIQK